MEWSPISPGFLQNSSHFSEFKIMYFQKQSSQSQAVELKPCIFVSKSALVLKRQILEISSTVSGPSRVKLLPGGGVCRLPDKNTLSGDPLSRAPQAFILTLDSGNGQSVRLFCHQADCAPGLDSLSLLQRH